IHLSLLQQGLEVLCKRTLPFHLCPLLIREPVSHRCHRHDLDLESRELRPEHLNYYASLGSGEPARPCPHPQPFHDQPSMPPARPASRLARSPGTSGGTRIGRYHPNPGARPQDSPLPKGRRFSGRQGRLSLFFSSSQQRPPRLLRSLGGWSRRPRVRTGAGHRRFCAPGQAPNVGTTVDCTSCSQRVSCCLEASP